MKEDDKKKIEEIIGGMQCPADFKCYKSELENVCKAQDIGLKECLACLEEDPRGCKFALPFGKTYLCRCPLRIYLAKELKR
jgi:hypothetical protein